LRVDRSVKAAWFGLSQGSAGHAEQHDGSSESIQRACKWHE
jgi:hypothetical protein